MRAVFFVFCLLAPFALHAEDEVYNETVEIKNEYQIDADVKLIEIENLAGVITIETGDEKIVESIVQVHACDKEKERAKMLAGKVGIQSTQDGEKLRLLVEYPLSEHSIYYYPIQTKGKKSSSKNRGRVLYQGREVTLFSDATPAAVQLSADVTLKVPKDIHVKVKNCTGTILVEKFSGELQGETAVGSVSLNQAQGSFTVQTGTGAIQLQDCQGTAFLNTGTGSIAVQSLGGALTVETGTGDIDIKKCDLQEVRLHSGSGTVELEGTVAGALTAFTGSGKIALDDCVVKNMIKADTGTGIIKMKGDFSALKSLALQTGTGSITFTSTPFPALDFQVASGSGRIENQVESVGGVGSALIRTGSGNIKINTTKNKKKRAGR